MHTSTLTKLGLVALIGLALPSDFSRACTAFSFTETQQTFVGKNYDWAPMHGHGAVFINKRGVAKKAQTLRTSNAVEWISKHGSITFSQTGIEFPVSGMNEAGLTAEILQLNSTEHIAETDPRPALNEAQWLQYQLDNFSSLSEVLAHVDQIRVEQAFLGVHYFICDQTGECGTFEFVKGRLITHSGSTLQPKVLTNSTYEESVEHLRNSTSADSQGGVFGTSLKRFVTASRKLEDRESRPDSQPVEFVFNVLKNVENTSLLPTQWSIAYDVATRTISYQTRANPSRKTLSLLSFDFSCQTPSLMTDIQQAAKGDIASRMKPLNYNDNKALIDQNWMIMNSELRRLAADYPFQLTNCVQ